MIAGISWIVIWTYDLGRMTSWYRDMLGLRVAYSTTSATAFEVGACVLVLLARRDNGPLGDPATQGWDRNQMVFTMKVHDMDEVLGKLQRRGVEPSHVAPVVIDGQDAPEWRVAQLMDPEGNFVELCDEPVRWFPPAPG